MPLRLPLLWLLAVAEVIHAASVNPSSSTPVLQPARAPQPAEVPPSKQQPAEVLPTDQQQPIRGLSAEPSTVTSDTSSAKLERVAALAKSSIAGEKPADDDDPNNPDGAAYGDFLTSAYLHAARRHCRAVGGAALPALPPPCCGVRRQALHHPAPRPRQQRRASRAASEAAAPHLPHRRASILDPRAPSRAPPRPCSTRRTLRSPLSTWRSPIRTRSPFARWTALPSPSPTELCSPPRARSLPTFGSMHASRAAVAAAAAAAAKAAVAAATMLAATAAAAGWWRPDARRADDRAECGGRGGHPGHRARWRGVRALDPQYPPQRLSQIIESARLDWR